MMKWLFRTLLIFLSAVGIVVLVTALVYAIFGITPAIREELGHYIAKYYPQLLPPEFSSNAEKGISFTSFWKFYFYWLKNVFCHGDLGYSLFDGKSFNYLLGSPIQTTLTLTLMSLIIALCIAFFMLFLEIRWEGRLWVRMIIGGIRTVSGMHYIILSYWILYGLNLRKPSQWVLICIIAIGNGVLVDTHSMLKEGYMNIVNAPYFLGIRSRASDIIYHLLKPLTILIFQIVYFQFPTILGGTFIVEFMMNIHALGLETIKAVVENDHLKLLVITLLIATIMVAATINYRTIQRFLDPRPVSEL